MRTKVPARAWPAPIGAELWSHDGRQNPWRCPGCSHHWGFLLVGSAAHGWIGALIALPVSIGLFALSHRVARFSTRLRTVGDLAEAVAVLNVAALASPDEPLHEREIWTALRGVIRNTLGWDGSVLTTTRLIQNGYTRLTRLHWIAIGAGLAILMFLVGWLGCISFRDRRAIDSSDADHLGTWAWLWITAIQMRGRHTKRAKRTVPNATASLMEMTIFDDRGCDSMNPITTANAPLITPSVRHL